MAGTGTPRAQGLVPESVRTTAAERGPVTRIVLVRHGEASCNVNGVVGGRLGCSGLTALGRTQVEALAARLARTGEFGAVDALYASVLTRAKETAGILAPALDAWRDGPPLEIGEDCDFCELHPGESDGLTWGEFEARFPMPQWDDDPGAPIAPGGESWTGFVDRAAGAIALLAETHPAQTVVVACHAGVVEASILRLLPVDRSVPRLRLRTLHASMTVWEYGDGVWQLQRYNDATPLAERS